MSLLSREHELDENKAGIAGKNSPSADAAASDHSIWLVELLDWIKTLVIAFAVVMLLHFFVFNLSKVEGHSMEPTITAYEWLL